ncbi:MAG: nickel-dependent lactate racemase [Deltaproteobacteria bacterium]|nr:nickel-dependent lactate racemase [Deltaproteobacteria bacterium]
MEIRVPYGQSWLLVDVPDENLTGVISPNEVPQREDKEVLEESLEHPIDVGILGDFLADGCQVLFLVNDATRPTPTARVLDLLSREIEGHPLQFLMATGTHRPPTSEEFRQIFGRWGEVFKKYILVHDARKESEMVPLGVTSRGTQLYLNRRVVEAHKVVAISSVEPHYFAGYTGGRKSFFPGVAAYQSTEQNHRLAMQKEAAPLALRGNPIHEDLVEAMGSLQGKEIYSLQLVLDRSHRIYAAFCGSLGRTFAAAVEKADEVFSVEVRERAEVVVTVAPYPMDIDLYQSQKALEHGKLALKEGGILILVSRCRMGIGNEGFYRLLSRAETPGKVFSFIGSDYHLGDHKAAKIAELAMTASIWGMTDLDPSILERAFIRPWGDLQEALRAAIKEKGPHAQVLFLMNGSMSVPKVGSDSR